MSPAPSGTATAARITLRCAACLRWNRISAERVADAPKCGSCATPLPLDAPILLDDATFDRTIAETTLPVLVDFYADWCGPCRMMAPAVAELARSSQGQLLVAKLDTEAAPRTAGRFGIRSLPTVVLFRGGVEAARQSGALPLGALRSFALGATQRT